MACNGHMKTVVTSSRDSDHVAQSAGDGRLAVAVVPPADYRAGGVAYSLRADPAHHRHQQRKGRRPETRR